MIVGFPKGIRIAIVAFSVRPPAWPICLVANDSRFTSVTQFTSFHLHLSFHSHGSGISPSIFQVACRLDSFLELQFVDTLSGVPLELPLLDLDLPLSWCDALGGAR
jgi:hypothetical protein